MNRLIRHRKNTVWLMSLAILITAFALIAIAPQPAFAATTELTITKYAVDKTTVLEQKTVDYSWLEENLEIMGDGVRHYYHQGPVFKDNADKETQELLRWNEEEDQNWDTKDMGAVRGTNVKDLCELVGGMATGDTLQIKASDNFTKTFAYKNVYQYSDREGPMVVCWERNGDYPDTGYTDGMRLVWFAGATPKVGPTSIEKLPSGDYNVFGNWDWRLAAAPEYWYYWYNGSEKYPTTTGLSVQKVSQLNIFSNEQVTATPPTLGADTEGNKVGQAVDLTFTDDAAWTAAITGITVNDSTLTSEQYSVTAGNINIIAGVFSAPVDYQIVVKATGYSDAVVTQTMLAAMDVLYEGAVTLAADKTLIVTAYNSKTEYTVKETTPLGALQKAATAAKFTYDITDKNYANSGALLLDNVGSYSFVKGGSKWLAYVNDVYKDGYNNAAGALNLIELADGDKVEFYYAAGISDATNLNAVKAAATAAVKTVAGIPTMDVLYNGTVALDANQTFNVAAYNSKTEYTVKENTPLGALQKAATAAKFTYDVTDKNYANSGALLLDNVGSYSFVKGGSKWLAYVNEVYKDGYNNAAGALNLIELADGDKVEFYYAAGISDATNLNAVKAAATAAVLTVVDTEATTPSDWSLKLLGAKDVTLTKAQFEEQGHPGSRVTWTDGDGNEWGGIPLWLLVAMVDDDPDVGDKPYNFNDDLAAQGYEIKIIAGDGWSTVLASADIARSSDYIVANTLNGEPLPLKTESGKDSWPLHLKGAKIAGGQQVGNIVRIELSGLPEPPTGWTLELVGDIGDTITQEEFEEGLACTGSGHYREWKDKDGNTWSGIPLRVLVGAVDDIERTKHWTFNDSLAANYNVKVTAADGVFSKTFKGTDIARSDNYIVANKMNGEPLTDDKSAPLRLVGPGVTKTDGSLGGSAVGNIARIEIPELQTPAAAEGKWNLTLNGKVSDVISQAEFESGLACPSSGHLVEWTDKDGNIWSGIPLWYLAGWVDDRKPHSYDLVQAVTGYKVVVKAEDGYSVDFDSKDINQSSNYIIANKCNGVALTDSWPLRLVGAGVAKNDGSFSGKSVGNIVEIKLTSFVTGGGGDVPKLRIVKYGEDHTTVLKEETLDYIEMQNRFDVIGDGTTVYKYEGITNNKDDIWDADETYPGGYKIENAIKGTLVRDLCGLVGGMGAGTDIVFVAKDGWETTLPYSSIYPDPLVKARQGEAVLAWYADGKYVPEYKDGMRLFFTPDDHIYGQWDMHETLPEPYWHYYYGDVMYPSCAGLSAKYITEIKVYSIPKEDWTLKLDGKDLGGLEKDISKTYFESALTCTMGANHKATYTDSKNRTWEGMPLWFLVGFVDDADQHSDNAFNNDLATSGYQVLITAKDGSSVIINSQDIIRNNNYIIANSLNGATLPDDDSNWPLRMVGPNVSGKQSIGRIESIKLVRSSSLLIPPALTADTDENRVGQAIDISFTDDAAWREAITAMTVDGLNVASTKYTVSSGKITIAESVFTEAKDYTVVFKATGYEDATVTQTIKTKSAVYTVTPVSDPTYTIGVTTVGIKTMTVNAGISGFKYFTVGIQPVASHSGHETVVFTHLRNGSQLQINSTKADFDQVNIAQAGFNVQAGDVIKVYIVDELNNAEDHNPVILQ